MSNVKRVYVEKKPPYAVAARALSHEIRHYLSIDGVKDVHMLIRYDCENVPDDVYAAAVRTVFSEPPVDEVFEETVPYTGRTFTVEYLPGQFDQRADSAEQCLKLLKEGVEPVVRSATTYVITGDITDEEFLRIQSHCMNPVDSHIADEKKPDTLIQNFNDPADVAAFDGFCAMEKDALRGLYDSLGLAMTFADFCHIQNYFQTDEHRDPTVTEIRVLDTYWSDHCRHTTFSTELKNVGFDDGFYRKPIEETYQAFTDAFRERYADRIASGDKYECLMELATLAAKQLAAEGKLDDLEESDEINACSIVVPVDVDGKTEEWLINFKNETHNHPTEIEPFGGAATCLGGAIRDPLSGRTYVYQAMRVSGAADPTVPLSETLPGKLPQKKIVREAAHGYSSYGNQIGLATGYVKEIYHPDYVAERMEIGAVMAAAPRRAVKRLTSDPGDVVILLGGRTGRDGIGGATGSSKAHTDASTTECGAEVQKGNPPTERKLQRLFRREEVSLLIKKCNDFGAGGVAVAIGELADGLDVNLDLVTKKYAGLDGTELAISESQERMAVVVAPSDIDSFLNYAAQENLEATVVAKVTEEPRLVLRWRGQKIVDIKRAFLNTNGAHQETDVQVTLPDPDTSYFLQPAIPAVRKALNNNDTKAAMTAVLSDLNVCAQKGLVEMFDGSIGASSVFMPFGGKYQLTPTQSMVAKVNVEKGDTDTVTMMAYGFDPYLSSWSPYHGAFYAVTESMARIAAAGGDVKRIRLTFQEYFRRMSEEPTRWSQPLCALLGAYRAQLAYGLPSIGGKDSMSGSFNDIDVPPTLVSFAVDTARLSDIITPELKRPGNALYALHLEKDPYDLPDTAQAMRLYSCVKSAITEGMVVSAYALDGYGIFAAAAQMAFGNGCGITFSDAYAKDAKQLFAPETGGVLVEAAANTSDAFLTLLKENGLAEATNFVGSVTDDAAFTCGDAVYATADAVRDWKAPLESVFATRATNDMTEVNSELYREKKRFVCGHKIAKPRVFIPVFPGTNCEYDSAKVFAAAGAETETIVFKNRSEADIMDSVGAFAKAIANAQIIMFPGGFSAGDEPEGSAKFYATAFRNEKIKEEVLKLLNERDGLVLGICNGFQALIKLGLVPFGDIRPQDADAPTLTYNVIGRHISKMAYLKVVSDKSPWLSRAKLGGIYAVPASHGEGRFVCSEDWAKKLFENGQVATQYVDLGGNASMDEEWNINGSVCAIEGITSPDGRVYGKMCHCERIGRGVAKNIYGEQDMQLFASGVNYFK
ncbi:MAG: phosphoribosylformylglycinamidine synthase [Lachnospiraceae bacterium]|nr:phosphoribosylformylglycinamidine synthase [Lachnospiraceae bacterium]